MTGVVVPCAVVVLVQKCQIVKIWSFLEEHDAVTVGHVHKYEAVFGYFVDIWIEYILINYFLLTSKVRINYALIINIIIFQKMYFVQKMMK